MYRILFSSQKKRLAEVERVQSILVKTNNSSLLNLLKTNVSEDLLYKLISTIVIIIRIFKFRLKLKYSYTIFTTKFIKN